MGPRSGDSKGRGQTQGRTAGARRVSRPGSCGGSVTTKASTGPTPPRSLRSRSLPERCRGSAQSVPPPSPGPHRPADTEPGRHRAPQRAPPRNGWAVTGCGRSREPPRETRDGGQKGAGRAELGRLGGSGGVSVRSYRGPGPDGQPLQDEGVWLPGCTPGTWAHMCAHKPI